MIAFLSIELGVLPSQLMKEDYNLIGNIISVMQSKAKLQEKQSRKSKR